jgi:hypothetical protein
MRRNIVFDLFSASLSFATIWLWRQTLGRISGPKLDQRRGAIVALFTEDFYESQENGFSP